MRCSTKDFLAMLKKVTKTLIVRMSHVSLVLIPLILILARAVRILKGTGK